MLLMDIVKESSASGATGANSIAGNRSVLFGGDPQIKRIIPSDEQVQKLKIIKTSKRKTVAGIPLLTFTRESI